MKIGLGILAAVAVLTVAILALTKPRPVPSTPASHSIPKHEAEPAPVPTSSVKSAPEVRTILDELVAAVIEGDLEKKSTLQERLYRIGLPAVGPMWRDVLGNSEGGHSDYRYHVAVRDTLFSMASPETGSELLNSWSAADEGTISIPSTAVGLRLGLFSDVVARVPPSDVGKRVIDLYMSAKSQAVKRSLIDLMGRLQVRFPELRSELERIMKEDPDSQLRSLAMLALSSVDPAVVLPEVVKKLKAILGDSKSRDETELEGVVEVLLKALPIDQALDLLKREIGDTLAVDQVLKLNKIGFALGWRSLEPGDPRLEVLLAKGRLETGSAMQLIYLGVVGMAPLRKNSDPRLTDLALQYLSASTDESVRSHALSMICALNRDEATLLGAFESSWKYGGKMAYSAAGQMKFHADKSPAIVEKMQSYVMQGSPETRARFIEGLRWGPNRIPVAVLDQLKSIASGDADEGVRRAATMTLKWAGAN